MTLFHIKLVLLILLFASCQTEPPSGNEIIFGDVIGMYEGNCARYINSTEILSEIEEASLTVFAFDLENAGVKGSCDRIEEYTMSVTSADASEIIFTKTISGNKVSLTYFSESDSIVLTQVPLDTSHNKIIFTGKRQ